MHVISIIQARIGSTRLPGKVMMKINNKPILQHIVEFLRHSQFIDQIVIATSTESEDDTIFELANSLSVKCFRGSSHDVLERYYECAKCYNGELVVRITADNPLIDPDLVDQVIQICQKTNCDYASNMINQTYPYGYLVEAFTFSILEKLHKQFHDAQSREHVTFPIRQNPNSFHVEHVLAPNHLRRPFWRLTVDHKEDFELISKIFSKLYVSNSYIKYEKIVDLLDRDKNLLSINKKWY